MKRIIALLAIPATLLTFAYAADDGIISIPTPLVEPAKPAVTYDRLYMTHLRIECPDGTNATIAAVFAPKSTGAQKINPDESTHKRVVIPDAIRMAAKVPQMEYAVGALVEAFKAYSASNTIWTIEASNTLWAIKVSNAVWRASHAVATNAPANP
jgi:hypothetical protein